MEFSLQFPKQSEHLAFSGHETFALRYGWLKKAFDAVIRDPSIFTREDAIVTLGAGKNMVCSMRHWALASGVLQEDQGTRGARLAPSPFGEYLFGLTGRDPFLEDVGSVWLLHWRICANERRATTWSWVFNLVRSTEFTIAELISVINLELQKRNAKALTPNTLKRDVDCFLKSYLQAGLTKKTVIEDTLESPLAELRLLRSFGSDLIGFNRGPQLSLRDELFVYALVDFWERNALGREALSFNEIAYAFGGPGCVFKLDEDSLVSRLERLELVTAGKLVYTDIAGLKQVYQRDAVHKEDLLEVYYGAYVGI